MEYELRRDIFSKEIIERDVERYFGRGRLRANYMTRTMKDMNNIYRIEDLRELRYNRGTEFRDQLIQILITENNNLF